MLNLHYMNNKKIEFKSMKNQPIYFRSIDLISANYKINRIVHGDCRKCPTAILLKAASAKTNIPVQRWSNLFCTITRVDDVQEQIFATKNSIIVFHDLGFFTQKKSPEIRQQAEELIAAGDYTLDELAKIENAFETAPYGDSDEEYLFNGIMAVIDALDEIHENNDLSITKEVKERFAFKILQLN